jgi:Anti-sigma-28 factor, FlgM
MFAHGPTCLKGPRSRKRSQWRRNTIPRTETPQDACFRADLVARVRREIADGTYDTPEKFEIALDRLLDRLERD